MEPVLESIPLCGFALQVPGSLIFQSCLTIPLKQSQHLTIPCFLPPSPVPKYIFTLIDAASHTKLKLKTMGVFIIPLGQETSWTFSTPEGLQELLLEINTSRVLYIALGHGFLFKDLLEIQEELKEVVLALMPPSCNTTKLAFMTNGDIGERALVYSSARTIVEDVREGDYYVRQLLFLSNVNQVQSEIRLEPCREDEYAIFSEGSLLQGPIKANYQNLTFEYQRAMLLALGFTPEICLARPIKILILGAGACVLPKFLITHFQNCEITAVDIDAQVVDIGKRFFGVLEDQRLHIIIEDALQFVNTCADGEFDYVFLDICVGESNVVTPPPQFTSQEFLGNIRRIMASEGVLAINVFGNEFQVEKIVAENRGVYGSMFKCKCRDDTNQILFCLKAESLGEFNWKVMVRGVERIEQEKNWDRTMALVEYAEGVKIVQALKSPQAILQGTKTKKKNRRKKN